MTPLMLAASRDEDEADKLILHGKPVSAVAYLLDRISPYRPSVCFENGLGHTALSAACMNGRLTAIDELLARGAGINQQSSLKGRSAFMSACLVGKLEVVKQLVKHGADASLKDHSGCTAHDLAVQNRHCDVVNYLEQLKES
jgi:ankyrin repeat protein